jgi:hypothetical protein
MDILLPPYGLGGMGAAPDLKRVSWKADLHRGGDSALLTLRSLPPVFGAIRGIEFVPDWRLPLLFDRLVLDEMNFEHLTTSTRRDFSHLSEFLRLLHREGRVHLENFPSRLSKAKSLISGLIEADVQSNADWRETLISSAEISEEFARTIESEVMHADAKYHELNALYKSRASIAIRAILNRVAIEPHLNHATSSLNDAKAQSIRADSMAHLRDHLKWELTHVNAVLSLSLELMVPFSDWSPYGPFYAGKAYTAVRDGASAQNHISALSRILELTFSEFQPSSLDHFVRCLDDKRVEDLRALVQDVADGAVLFDEAYVRDVFHRVLDAREQLWFRSKISGLILNVLGIIPYVGLPLQLTLSYLVDKVLEKRASRGARWFYLLREIDKRPR